MRDVFKDAYISDSTSYVKALYEWERECEIQDELDRLKKEKRDKEKTDEDKDN